MNVIGVGKPIPVANVMIEGKGELAEVKTGGSGTVAIWATPMGAQVGTFVDDKALIKGLIAAMTAETKGAPPTNQANAQRVLVDFITAKSLEKSGVSAAEIDNTRASLDKSFRASFGNGKISFRNTLETMVALTRARDAGLMSNDEFKNALGLNGKITRDVNTANVNSHSGDHLAHNARSNPFGAPSTSDTPTTPQQAAPSERRSSFLTRPSSDTPALTTPKQASAPTVANEKRGETKASIESTVARLMTPQSEKAKTSDLRALVDLLVKGAPLMIYTGRSYAMQMRQNQDIANAVEALSSSSPKDVGKNLETLNKLLDRSVAYKLLSAEQGAALKPVFAQAMSTDRAPAPNRYMFAG